MSIKSFFGIREDEPELAPKPEYAPEYAPEIEPRPELKESKFEYNVNSRPALEELVSDQPTTDPLPVIEKIEPEVVEPEISEPEILEQEIVEPEAPKPVPAAKRKRKAKAKILKPKKRSR